ncbi:hypothetical protein N7540_007770 [Penicillium herquei]|nr:hypothetical protein N7540_007770 [Penicillium herquei]
MSRLSRDLARCSILVQDEKPTKQESAAEQSSPQVALSLGDLPLDIVLTICDFCDTQSLVNLARSSKGFLEILESTKNDRARQGFLCPPEAYSFEYRDGHIPQMNPWMNEPMPWMWMYKRAPGGYFTDTGYLYRVIETGKIDGLKFLLDLGANQTGTLSMEPLC